MSRTFEVSPDGKQLWETVRITDNKGNHPVTVRYAYDAVDKAQMIGQGSRDEAFAAVPGVAIRFFFIEGLPRRRPESRRDAEACRRGVVWRVGPQGSRDRGGCRRRDCREARGSLFAEGGYRRAGGRRQAAAGRGSKPVQRRPERIR